MSEHPDRSPLSPEDLAVLAFLEGTPENAEVRLPSGAVMGGQEASVLSQLMNEGKEQQELIPIMPAEEMLSLLEMSFAMGVPRDAILMMQHAHASDGRCGWVVGFGQVSSSEGFKMYGEFGEG